MIIPTMGVNEVNTKDLSLNEIRRLLYGYVDPSGGYH